MEKPESYFNPPRYQRDAVASDKGWHHPQTGELIVCRKGLLGGQTASHAIVDDNVAHEEVVEQPVVEEPQLLTDTPETVQTVITEIEEIPSEEVLTETTKTNSKKSKK